VNLNATGTATGTAISAGIFNSESIQSAFFDFISISKATAALSFLRLQLPYTLQTNFAA
jgi:hypothetical protein